MSRPNVGDECPVGVECGENALLDHGGTKPNGKARNETKTGPFWSRRFLAEREYSTGGAHAGDQ